MSWAGLQTARSEGLAHPGRGDRGRRRPTWSSGAADETIRFNSLPFRTEGDTDASQRRAQPHPRSDSRDSAQPGHPRRIRRRGDREIPTVVLDAELDGSLIDPPSEPRGNQPLHIIDQAALSSHPKPTTSCARTSTRSPKGWRRRSAYPAHRGPGDEPTIEFSNDQIDSARVVFPFPANRAPTQSGPSLSRTRRPTWSGVEGPPGTGKSLTIANLACHLAASGKTVLITSQKDKALEVVDETCAS